jgi:hypothetical protein
MVTAAFTIFFGLELFFIRILAIADAGPVCWADVLGRRAGAVLGEH